MDANAPGFGSGDGGRQEPRGLVGMRAEKDTRVMLCRSWKSWIVPDTEVGLPATRSTIGTLVTRAQFLATQHQYSCEQTRC